MARRRKKKPACIACSGTGKNSRGNDCVCVQMKKPKRQAKKFKALRAEMSPERRAANEKAAATVLKTIPTPTVIKRRPKRSRFATTFVKREARSMFTTEIGNAQLGDRVKGAFVRVKATESDTAADLESFGAFLKEMGALVVKTLSAATAPALKSREVSEVEISNLASPRDAVEAILEEEDDDELSEVVEESMSEVGL